MQQDERRYEPNPRYPAAGAPVRSGWAEAVADLPDGVRVLAVDGPWLAHWDQVAAGLAAELPGFTVLDLREHLAAWDEIRRRTEPALLADDPNFLPLSDVELARLFDELPTVADDTIVLGPGAALLAHDALWYADLPKRYAEAAITGGTGGNLGQRSGAGTTKRLFYVDWPILDRHRDAVAGRLDRLLDVQDPARPASLDGGALRTTAATLAHRPFRTRPTFNTTSWGGHWGQRELGFNPEARNTALGYELIAPESGVLVGDDRAAVEVPFQALVALHPVDILGGRVHETFGLSFPIRFDYLDTVDGGNLSVHCHPQSSYMRDVFGWPYTQHETYYMMVGGEQNRVFLGLRGDADIERFHREAHEADEAGTPFDITRYVQTFPAKAHQLFLVPAGTPHGSGEGNVVLEVSATPYLYSLRFYDWLRRDGDGRQRAVHVEHAFRNLNRRRTGDEVRRDLVQEPAVVRHGEGWSEERLGALPEMFFTVHRIVLDSDDPATDHTDGAFHVLNVVEGDGVNVETEAGDTHRLNYAETLVVPAAVGRYTLTRLGGARTRLVKSFVV